MQEKIIKAAEMKIINLGLKGFQESVQVQNIPCVHVNWRPPAGGDLELIEVLDHLKEFL